jgi:hypothetical protein
MSIVLNIVSDFDTRGIKKAERAFADLQNNSKKLGSSLKSALLPAAVAIGGLGAVMFSAAKDAVDYGETLNAVFVTFGKQGAEEIGKLAEASAKTYGLSKTDFNNMAVSFSNFAKDLATPKKKATKIVADLSKRVADFASVMNLEVPDAAAKFASALAGEAEPMKKFGINISDAAIKAFALENNIGKVSGKLSESEKAVARYGVLMEKTAIFAGDFANTSDSLANQQKILKAEFDNVKIAIGTALLPIFQRLVRFVSEQVLPIIQRFADKLGKDGLAKTLQDSATDLGNWLSEAEGATGAALDFGGAIVLLAGAFKGLAFLTGVAATLTAVNTALAGLAGIAPALGAAGLGVIAGAIGLLVINLAALFSLMRDNTDRTYIVKAIQDFCSLIANAFIGMYKGIRTVMNLLAGAGNFVTSAFGLGDQFGKLPDVGFMGMSRASDFASARPSTITNAGANQAGVPGAPIINITTGIGDPVAIGKSVVDALQAYQNRSGPLPLKVG